MTNNESVVGPDRKRLPQGGWELLESGLDSSDAESGAANRRNVVGAGVMIADGLMARSASSADESESAKLPTGALSEVEKRSLFTEMADEILDRDHNADDMKKYPYGLQVGYAAEMLEVMCEGIERGKKIIATRGVRDVFDPKKSLTENARAAEETLTAQFMKDGLSEDESDGEWYPMSGGQSRIPDNLDVVVFANYLASVSEKEKHAGRMRETIKNGMTEKEVDNFMSLCPMFRVSTDENGQKQMKYTLVKADKMREMMENRATQKEAAEKPSDNQYSEPENSQPAETADREAESSPESPLSFGELRKLFRGISNNLDSNKTADRHQALGWSEKFPCRQELGGAARMLDSLVVTMQFGDEKSTEPLLQETFDPDLSPEDNLQRAVDYRTEELKRHLDGRNSDGRRYPVSAVNYPGLVTVLFAQKLYETCIGNPDGARNMIENVVDNPSEDGDRIIDTLSAMRPVYSIDAEGNVKWEFFDSGKVNRMMKKRKERKAAARAAENYPSQVEDRIKESAGSSHPEPEESQPADREIGYSQESLSSEEQIKLIDRIFDDVVGSEERISRRRRIAEGYAIDEGVVYGVLDAFYDSVANKKGSGFLRDVYNPELSLVENVRAARQRLADDFLDNGIGGRKDGGLYVLDDHTPEKLKEAVFAEHLIGYLCNPDRATEGRQMIAEGVSNEQEDEIMMRGKHLGFTYTHGRLQWHIVDQKTFQEGIKPLSLEQRLSLVEQLQRDLPKQRVSSEAVRKTVAAALESLHEEISAARQPDYLSDEDIENEIERYSRKVGRRVEMTPGLQVLIALKRKYNAAQGEIRKVRGYNRDVKEKGGDTSENYIRLQSAQYDSAPHALALSTYRHYFGDGDLKADGNREDAYNINVQLRKIAQGGDSIVLLREMISDALPDYD